MTMLNKDEILINAKINLDNFNAIDKFILDGLNILKNLGANNNNADLLKRAVKQTKIDLNIK